MKKISFVFVTMLTFLLSGILMACSLKDAEANFSKEEHLVSVGDPLNLDDYLNVKGIEKDEVSYLFSSSSMIQDDNGVLKAKESGKCIVYAVYQNNSLASMKLVVKKTFASPKNFTLSEGGLLSWGVVSDYFEDDDAPTKASSYSINGTFIEIDSEGNESKPVQVKDTVNSNSYQLDKNKKGKYSLSVTANASGYFDESEPTQLSTFYFGAMETPEVESLSFSPDGTFSWGAVPGAKYKVKLDNKILVGDYLETTSQNISSFLENASYGWHYLSVVVYDKNGDKISRVSNSLQIRKLQSPTVQYSLNSQGAYIDLTNLSEADSVVVVYKKAGTEDVKTFEIATPNDSVKTFMDEIPAGAYEVAFMSKTTKTNTYQSSLSRIYNVYKLPSVQISGLGNNQENGNKFNAQITTSESLVDTNFVVESETLSQTIEGFDKGSASKNIEVNIPDSGTFDFALRQDPKTNQNFIDIFENQMVYVLSSNTSSYTNVTKLAVAKNLVHQYEQSKSVFVFDRVENATDYLLYNNGVLVESDKYTWLALEENKINVTLIKKVDDLFDDYNFAILAKTDNDLLAINSLSDIKKLEVLSAPTSANSGNSTNKTYTFTASENADKYRLEIYTLPNKNTVDLSGITPETKELDTNSYTFENEGYYYVKVYAISEDENNYLNSKTCLEENFYIAEQLTLGEVALGYDQSLAGQNGSLATGYFVRIANIENADFYQLKIGNQEPIKIDKDITKDYTEFNLTTDFTTEENLKITALSNNSELYVESEEEVLTVKQLECVTLENIGEFVYVDELTQRIYIEIPEGASYVKMSKDNNNKAEWDSETGAGVDTISLSIKDWTNFDLDFVIKGTKKQNNLFEGQNVYLDAQTSTIHFERETTPTNLEFANEKLIFEHPNASSSFTYVLDLICDSNGRNYSISIKFETISTYASCVQIGVTNFKLNKPSNQFRSTSDGKYVTIDLAALLDYINSIPALASVYANSTTVEFATYVYKNGANLDNDVYELSSLYATCKSDSSNNSLSIQKMSSPVLEFAESSATDYKLKWSPVSLENADINALTTYEIYTTASDEKIDGTLETNAQGILTYTFSKTGFKTGEYYSFYIVAKNPHYLESNSSNIIKLYQLNTLQGLKLSTDGSLELLFDSKDINHIEKVVVNEEDFTSYNNISASLGELKVEIVGKIEENSGVVTHYINSDETTWNIEDFASLAPTDLTVEYDTNGNMSWKAYAESKGLSSLKYRVIFVDEKNQSVYFDINETTINVLSGDVYNTISAGLSAGNITVQVVAMLDTYSVAQETTLYYSDKITLLNDQELYNAKTYTQKSIIKLKTPEVESVEIENEDFSAEQYPTFAEKNISIDLSSPNLSVTFVGNYGDTPKVMAFINDNETPVFSGVVNIAEGKYTFNISSANYDFENGEMIITIKVEVAETIPSSLGSVTIKKAIDISKIEFVKDSEIVSNKVKITLAENGLASAVGGIILKVDYLPNETSVTKTEYTLANITSGSELLIDLSNFVEENLSVGGTIKVSALINSYDTNKVYYLPSSIISTEEIEVLKSVKESDITHKEGGVIINTENGSDCTYIISANGKTYDIDIANDEFYFEFPNDWADGKYTLTIHAEQNGKMSSVASNIEVEISRIAQVEKSSIQMQRDSSDLSKISISWNAVENATNYKIKVYDNTDSSLILEKTLVSSGETKEEYLLSDILGENYSEIESKMGTAFLTEDQNLLIEIITLGTSTTNDSYKTSVDVLLKGNTLISQDSGLNNTIIVDDFGRLSLDLQQGEYIYKLSTSAYETDPWKEISVQDKAILIDLTEFSKQANEGYLEVSLAKRGNLEGENKTFEIDSYSLTSVESYKFNNSIVAAGYHQSFDSSMTIEILRDGFTQIFVGLSQEALLNGDVASVRFGESLVGGSISTNLVYKTSFANFLDDLIAGGIELPDQNQEITLYLWSYQSANENVKFLASKPQEFKFNYEVETSFVGIDKLGEAENAHDFANVYAVYENKDSASVKTLGVFVRVTTQDQVLTKFVSQSKLEDETFDSNLVEAGEYKINLTKIFEEEDLIDFVGDVEVSFARLQVVDSKTFAMTMWTDETKSAEKLEFTRLNQVKNVRLSGGNLYWEGIPGGKYYVYLVKVNDSIKDITQDPTKLTSDFVFNPVAIESYDSSGYDLNMAINENATYYIAVQAYNGDAENEFVLPSKRIYVEKQLESGAELIEIYKNQISSPLVLKDGQIYINWAEQSEVYKNLSSANPSAEDLLSETPFANPFTFTIEDLLADKVTFRLSLTSKDSGVVKNYDINAKHLLANLFGANPDVDFEKKLSDLYSQTTAGSAQTKIREFINYCRNASYGVANTKKIFDDIFETLQMGGYSLKYCLLGNDESVSSNWYSFENVYGENTLYVNGQPESRIAKHSDPNDVTYNEYKLIIKKSQLYKYISENVYETVQAENYVIKLTNSAGATKIFDIIKNDSSYSLTLKDSKVEGNVSVYESDINGNIAESGNYLMVYINQNNGDSILGLYTHEIEKLTYDMQIYTVGNDVTFSSKSKYHALTFLGFSDNVSINNGAFVWATQTLSTRKTTVVYKSQSANNAEHLEVGVSEDGFYSRYTLFGEDGKDLGEGLYEYVKFIRVGEERTNSTFIDSEIYEFKNVYKLSGPSKLANDFGYLSIEIGDSDYSYLTSSYSDSNIFNYRIYHDAISYSELNNSSYLAISDERIDTEKGLSALLYQTGESSVDSSFEKYKFKQEEKNATKYFVASMGSTIASTSMKYQEGEAENYNVRTYYLVDEYGNIIVDENGASKDFSISIRSEFKEVSAHMLTDVGDLAIENGLLKWTEVKSSSNQLLHIDSPVYKINAVLYEESATGQNSSGEILTTPTNTIVEKSYYTAKTFFDFTKIEEDVKEFTNANTLIKVSVQALALELCDEYQENSNYIKLIEGGYARGNSVYKDADGNITTTYVLMSNAVSLEGIKRFDPIVSGSLDVVDGRLTWNFVAQKGLTEQAFKNAYGFEVVQTIDGKENLIDGDFNILTESNGTYVIQFVEEKGAFLPGVGSIVVYVTQGETVEGYVIKSFATQLDNVEKLETIKSGDYTILSETDSETLDFSEFFAQNETLKIITTVLINNAKQNDIIFTNSKTKLLILSEVPSGNVELESDYAGYLAISDSQVVKLIFEVRPQEVGDIVYSDLSDEFVLQRSSWGQDKQITWNEQTQEFVWDYSLNTLNSQVRAQEVKEAYIAKDNIVLYQESELITQSGNLSKGQKLFEVEIGNTVSKVVIDNTEHYTLTENLQKVYLASAKTLQETVLYTNEFLTETAQSEGGENLKISADTQILVVEVLTNSVQICYENKLYYVEIQAIENVLQTISNGDLFEILEESATDTIIVFEDKFFKVSSVNIVKPVYIIEATYGETDSVVRLYETTQKSFKPTIIGKVAISVRIKLGNTNVQSQELTSQGFIDFKMFSSGEGTSASAYVINSAEEFENIAYRMSKDEYLKSYIQVGLSEEVVSEDKFYFQLNKDIDLNIEGILFKGEFEGVLDGNNHKVSYVSSKTTELQSSLIVPKGQIGPIADDANITFVRGSALFENVDKNARISNLNISATYGTVNVSVPNNALIGGLAIKNSGTIENVNLIGFANKFYGKEMTTEAKNVIAYSGIVAINSGMTANINNCSVLTNIEISDNSTVQNIFVGGISYLNTESATISNCVVGQAKLNSDGSDGRMVVNYVAKYGYAQIAGIVVTNSSANLRENTNNMDIAFVGPQTSATIYLKVYTAGITCYRAGTGTVESNTNGENVDFTASNYAENEWTHGDLIIEA